MSYPLVCTVTPSGGSPTDRSAWALRATLQITDNYNAPSTLRLTFKDRDALTGYRPDIDDAITITENDVAKFGGLVLSPDETGSTNRIEVSIDAIGYLDAANYCFVTATWAAGATLKSVLQYLVTNYLARYSLSLATMADGPTMPALAFVNVKCMDVLTQLASIAGGVAGTGPWAVAVSAAKALSMVTPGGAGTATAIRDGDGYVRGVPRFTKTKENFADKVLLVCGDNAQHVLDWGPITANGSATEWYTDYVHATGPSFFLIWVTFPAGAENFYFLGSGASPFNLQLGPLVSGLSGGYRKVGDRVYTYGPAMMAAFGFSVCPAGTLIRFRGDTWQFPFTVIRDLNSAVPRETLLTAPSILDVAAGQYQASAECARRSLVKKQLVYQTHAEDALPNMLQSTQVSRRGIATPADYLITQAVRTQAGKLLPRYAITSVEGAFFQVTSSDYWKALGSGSGSGSSIVTGGGGGTGPASAVSLGGSVLSNPLHADSWTTVWNGHACRFTVPTTGVYTVIVTMCAVAASIGVTARIYDMTAAAAVAPTSSKVTKQLNVTDLSDMTTFNVNLTAGHVVVLQMLSDTAGAYVFAGGSIIKT